MSKQYDPTKVGQQAQILGGVHTSAVLNSLYLNIPAGSTAFTSDLGPMVNSGGAWEPSGASATIAVGASRPLTAADNGLTLECTAATLTLSVPAGLGANFGCAVIPNGTTSIASSGGTLLNGATSTVTRAAASNAIFALVPRSSAVDSYVVTGS
jgi:hypothetical protein